MSMVLHWLVSLSFFVVRITVRDLSDLTQNPSVGNTNGKELLTCAWSPIAIITAMILGAVLLLLLCLNGCRRYKPGVPLGGSSSAVIGAACHRPETAEDAAVLPVRWGSVRNEGPVGHCCFTSFESSFPEEGNPYAGRTNSTSVYATHSSLEADRDPGQGFWLRNSQRPEQLEALLWRDDD